MDDYTVSVLHSDLEDREKTFYFLMLLEASKCGSSPEEVLEAAMRVRDIIITIEQSFVSLSDAEDRLKQAISNNFKCKTKRFQLFLFYFNV